MRLIGRSPVAGSPPRFELCIYADDVERAAEELVRGGARLLVLPTDRPWGERLLYVEDPDGNPIQVTARIATQPPRGTAGGADIRTCGLARASV